MLASFQWCSGAQIGTGTAITPTSHNTYNRYSISHLHESNVPKQANGSDPYLFRQYTGTYPHTTPRTYVQTVYHLIPLHANIPKQYSFHHYTRSSSIPPDLASLHSTCSNRTPLVHLCDERQLASLPPGSREGTPSPAEKTFSGTYRWQTVPMPSV